MNIFNLSLDDITYHPKCDPFINGSIKWCEKLIKNYPNIKIDFFIPAAFARLNEDPYYLSRNLEWAKKLNSLSEKNYSFNTHSYFHRRLSVKYGNSNNNEVEKTNEQDTKMIISHMINEFDLAGIKYKKCFRAPGFHIGFSAAKVLTEMGFTICGNQKYYDLLKDRVKNMKYLVYNWDLLSDCQIKNSNVFAVGHTSNWTSNFLNENSCDKILKLLDSENFKFKFLCEV